MAYESYPIEKVKDRVIIGGQDRSVAALPKGHRLDKGLGLVVPESMTGQLLYTNYNGYHGGLFETRAVKTPGGDYLLMFPSALARIDQEGTQAPDGHYSGKKLKVNDLVAFRSKDGGRSWRGPSVPFDIDYNQHGFVPLVPRSSKRIYAFGTQPVWGMWNAEGKGAENTPIGYRYSDDDGYGWSEVRLIRPRNDPGYLGMSVMQMTETDRGAWLLGTHASAVSGEWTCQQYMLRSVDQGQVWDLLPGPRPGGWTTVQNFMGEGRPIALGGGKIYMLARTTEGHLWESRSDDDGQTWTTPKPSVLVNGNAPPMLFHLSDGKTLVAFVHNRGLLSESDSFDYAMAVRQEIWVSLSSDEGLTWTPPRFVLTNALAPRENNPWLDNQCSYLDMFTDRGELHIFMPHRWRRALYLHMKESDLTALPTAGEL